MPSTHKLFILFAFMGAALAYSSMAEARLFSNLPRPMVGLAARLKVEGEPSNCWESLFQLQACSGEVITFFLNGETYLGPGCCQAIWVIGHDCWPNIIGSLGFTTQESDILQGYCDEAVHSPPSPPSVVEPRELVP